MVVVESMRLASRVPNLDNSSDGLFFSFLTAVQEKKEIER
jgi:hypothetical protein